MAYVVIQAFQLLYSVVAHVQFPELGQLLQALNLHDSIRLNG